MSPLPIELIINILKLYFHTDSHSTPLSVQIPSFSLPHAASLRLVHSSFLAIVDGDLLLFRTVVLRTSEDWARYFADDSGVLVSGEGSDERARAVREIALSLTGPDLPLKKGLTPRSVRWVLDSNEFSRRFLPLTVPTFRSSVRYVDLGTLSDSDEVIAQHAYQRNLFTTDELKGYTGGWLSFLFDSNYRKRMAVCQQALRPFFVKSAEDSEVPTVYASVSTFDRRAPKLAKRLSRIEPLFDDYERDELPTTFIYRSSLLPSSKVSSSPASSPSNPSEKIKSTDPTLDDLSWLSWDLLADSPSYFTNVSLVGYPIGDPSRKQLQAKLKVLAAELEEETDILCQWRWIEENGKTTLVINEEDPDETED